MKSVVWIGVGKWGCSLTKDYCNVCIWFSAGRWRTELFMFRVKKREVDPDEDVFYCEALKGVYLQ